MTIRAAGKNDGDLAPHLIDFLVDLLLVGIALLLLGGCTLLPNSDAEEVEPSTYSHVLPDGWEAIREWQAVNLDGDETEEHLLLFRFDHGQVGALIVEGDPAAPSSAPERLLPRFFDDQGELGHGVIAAPGMPSRGITITQVSGNMPSQELTIFAGGTHLTFAWWKGEGQGYGVTQLYAPGGFGVDWETWQAEPAPIAQVMGYYPLQDYRARANLCEVVLYTRRTDLPSDLPTITYRAHPQGLHFCGSTIPEYPFAPEGVVMAYLRWPRAADAGMIKFLTPGTTLAQLDAESAAERWPLEHVADIAAYRSVPLRQSDVGDTLSPTTTVCVEFAENVNTTLRRWIVYTLRYQPPDVAQRLPERWTVSGAMTEPPPVEASPVSHCESILRRNPP